VATVLALVVLSACADVGPATGRVEASASRLAEATSNPVLAKKPKPKPSNGVTVPASIDRTGSTNVSGAMANFIGGVPNGSTIVFPAGATYLLDGDGIVLTGRRNLVFSGKGAEIRFTGCKTSDSAFKLNSTSGIVIEDFVLVGDNPGSYHAGCEGSEGVAMYGAQDTTIRRVKVRSPYGHCWYADQREAGEWTDGVLIDDTECVGAGVMGFAVTGGRNITVQRSTFRDTAIITFDIEPSRADGGGEYITIQDNVIDGYGISESYTPWVLAAATSVGSVHHITFERNTVIRGANHGSTLAGLATRMNGSIPKSDIIIRNNTTTVPGSGPVMRFANVNGLTVTGNTQPLAGGSLTSCSGCTNVNVQ
jgi:hypothetical protein